MLLPNLALTLKQIQQGDPKIDARGAGAALRDRIVGKLLDRATGERGVVPRPAAVELSEAQRMQHISSTIDNAVPARTAIIGTCSRIQGTVAMG